MNSLAALGICGSLRRGSYNLKLLKRALSIADEEGVSVGSVDQKIMNLPLYNADLEAAGVPEAVQTLKSMIEACDVLLIASPEYNYSMSGTLKNAIDWVSRIKPNPFSGKVAAIFGASTGVMGTGRGQLQLRQVLLAVDVLVLPQPQLFLSLADDNSFDKDGMLKNKVMEHQLRELLRATFKYAQKVINK
ncbi:MAG: NAD(P)H-dependent oxidoreductase [Endomicrobiales bacterium]|jgi:chromate reductase